MDNLETTWEFIESPPIFHFIVQGRTCTVVGLTDRGKRREVGSLNREAATRFAIIIAHLASLEVRGHSVLDASFQSAELSVICDRVSQDVHSYKKQLPPPGPGIHTKHLARLLGTKGTRAKQRDGHPSTVTLMWDGTFPLSEVRVDVGAKPEQPTESYEPSTFDAFIRTYFPHLANTDGAAHAEVDDLRSQLSALEGLDAAIHLNRLVEVYNSARQLDRDTQTGGALFFFRDVLLRVMRVTRETVSFADHSLIEYEGELERVARRLRDIQLEGEVQYSRVQREIASGGLIPAHTVGSLLLEAGRSISNPTMIARGSRACGESLLFQGQLQKASEALLAAIASAQPDNAQLSGEVQGVDHLVASRAQLGLTRTLMGDDTQADESIEASLTRAAYLQHWWSLGMARLYAA